jgi:hypothetical protein
MKTRNVKPWLVALTTAFSVAGCLAGIVLRRCVLRKERAADACFQERALYIFEDEGGLVVG